MTELNASLMWPRRRFGQGESRARGLRAPLRVLGYPGSVIGYPGSVLGYPGSVQGYPGSTIGYPDTAHLSPGGA
eukprot:5628312-Pyramimonas_sp.AAC.1